MDSFWYAIYNILGMPFLRLALLAGRLFDRKVRRGLDGRKNLFGCLEEALPAFEAKRPRFWIHNSSMGEFEQAKPLIEALKERFPGSSVAVTFFSPSGLDHVKQHPGADLLCYLPLDSRRSAERFVRSLKPDIGVVVRHDIWPNHIRSLKRNGIPAVLINFSLRPGLRLRLPFVRGLLRFLLDPFDAILAVSREAVQSGLACGLDPSRLQITGDTRYDQVVRRTRDAESAAAAPLRPLKSGRFGLVFGSTWPSDEAVIFPLLGKLRDASERAWSVMVPHEPTEKHLAAIETQCGRSGLTCRRLSAVESSGPGGPFDVLIVDRVGILASLYAVGDAAFVGGGFGPGVHSVLEPAAFGMPVFFGPRCGNSYEAGQLRSRGGGFMVSDADGFIDVLLPLIRNRNSLKQTGEKSLALVRENLGATGRIVGRLEALLNSRD
jgi:3-deoxy-D-manno-octulosonic-acid transferase